jgi:hypothetical protein
MQSSEAENLFSLSYMWMTFFLLVVMSVCCWKPRGFLSSNFDMKDLGEASFIIGIEIH